MKKHKLHEMRLCRHSGVVEKVSSVKESTDQAIEKLQLANEILAQVQAFQELVQNSKADFESNIAAIKSLL